MTRRDVRCAHCRTATLAERRPNRTGGEHYSPAPNVRVHYDPNTRNVVLLVCVSCGRVSEWFGKRILIVDAG